MTIDAKEREGSDITFGGKHSVYTLKMLNDKNSKDDQDLSKFNTPDGQNQESILNYGENLSQEKDSFSKL